MTLYYLHIDGIHHDQYEDLEECIKIALEHVRNGCEIHIQTREQWLIQTDNYEEEKERIYQIGYKHGKEA